MGTKVVKKQKNELFDTKKEIPRRRCLKGDPAIMSI